MNLQLLIYKKPFYVTVSSHLKHELSRETTSHSYLSRIIQMCLATGPYLYI